MLCVIWQDHLELLSSSSDSLLHDRFVLLVTDVLSCRQDDSLTHNVRSPITELSDY